LYDTAELLWLATPIASPLCNGVFRAALTPDRIDATIDAVLARHAAMRSPLSWWVGPSTQPSDLAERLAGRGFRLVAEEPGMAIDLTAFRPDATEPAGLDVVPVTNAITLREWVTVTGVGDRAYAEGCEAVYAPDCFAEASPVRLFLGRRQGVAVATSILFEGSCVASVQNVITHPAARRQGFGTAMTLAALRAARERGHQRVVLTATPMAARLYQRLGFRQYCTLEILRWDDFEAGSDGRQRAAV
jgi:ribosomal protein S18 acetylase RimI-like enzyme